MTIRRITTSAALSLVLGGGCGRDKSSVLEPSCVIWRDTLRTGKEFAVMDLAYDREVCEHVTKLLNADEVMHGSNGADFFCRCEPKR